MDLRSVADILVAGGQPDILVLQQQVMRLVEEEYAAANGSPFPLRKFSEFVYRLRVDDKTLAIPEGEWPDERAALGRRRLVVPDFDEAGQRRWRFRHDNISDYFLLCALQNDESRYAAHLSDTRFVGVFVLLARKLAPSDAEAMLSVIMLDGARNDDFTVGKAFYDALDQALAMRGERISDTNKLDGQLIQSARTAAIHE